MESRLEKQDLSSTSSRWHQLEEQPQGCEAGGGAEALGPRSQLTANADQEAATALERAREREWEQELARMQALVSDREREILGFQSERRQEVAALRELVGENLSVRKLAVAVTVA